MSALPGWWRWMAGMRWHMAPGRGVGGHDLGRMSGRVDEMWRAVDDCGRILTAHDGIVPDEADPATRGCLTARVREMWGDDAHVGVNHRDPSEWIVWARLGAAGWWSVVARGPTEWAALMAAGDAAWARRENPTTSKDNTP